FYCCPKVIPLICKPYKNGFKSMKNRLVEFEVSVLQESTLISIPSKLKPIEKTLLVSWIIAWTFCGIVIGLSMFNNYSRDIILMMFVYMVFWIFYEYSVLKTLFWRLWGVEYLRIDEAGIDY